MGTMGFFAYRYKRKYYRQFLRYDSSPSADGQRLVNMVPRDPSAFKDWVTDRIKMLENAKTIDTNKPYDDIMHPEDGVGADSLAFNTTRDPDWTINLNGIEWTYVVDLDNLVFTINGTIHLKLDNLPPNLDDYGYKTDDDDDRPEVPSEYLVTMVDLWPAPDFNIEERQQKYEALQPITTTEWGAPIWGELSVSQQFAIEITHHLLRIMSSKFTHAYFSTIRRKIGVFCWNVLCASVPALPLFHTDDDFKRLGLSLQTLSCGNGLPRCRQHLLYSIGSDKTSKSSENYFWVRGCLITFCVRLGEPIYVAHEVEQLVQEMRRHQSTESVGIILSSQQELVAVAVDGPTVRHSPVLDIRVTSHSERPGRASDGQLLLTYLLSPPVTVPRLPWRRPLPSQSPPIPLHSITKLPPEIIRLVVHHVDMGTYLALCRVSRSVRSVCVANPRVGKYTVLHRVPGFTTVFAARSTDDGGLKTINLQWRDHGHRWHITRWEFEEISSKKLDRLKLKYNVR